MFWSKTIVYTPVSKCFVITLPPNIFARSWWPKQIPNILSFVFFKMAFVKPYTNLTTAGSLSLTDRELPDSITVSRVSYYSSVGY